MPTLALVLVLCAESLVETFAKATAATASAGRRDLHARTGDVQALGVFECGPCHTPKGLDFCFSSQEQSHAACTNDTDAALRSLGKLNETVILVREVDDDRRILTPNQLASKFVGLEGGFVLQLGVRGFAGLY
eukprot:1299236-Rhodomonas_salina.2